MPNPENKDEYLSFDVVKDKETFGCHRPGLLAKINDDKMISLNKPRMQSAPRQEGGKKHLYTQKNVRHKITCVECGKIQLVFAFPFPDAHWSDLKHDLNCMMEEPGYEYVCGNTLFGCNIGDDYPHPSCLDVSSVHNGHECGTEIESYYYSMGAPAVCSHCGVDSGLLASKLLDDLLDSNTDTQGKKGRPMCNTCHEQGLLPSCWGADCTK